MRIICPNCGAQYEVDDRVIPDIGRDVQCSNCGHTWFQRPPSAVATSVRRVVEDPPVSPGQAPGPAPGAAPGGDRTQDAAARAADAFPPIADDAWEDDDAPDPVGPDPVAPDPVAPSRTAPASADPDPVPAAAVPTAPAAATPIPFPASPVLPEAGRPALDDATRALLREEAEREVQARAADRRPPVEVQGDFGLAAAPPPSRPVQRSADLAGDTAVSPVATALAAAASRRESLPDVDSISSSLRTSQPGADGDADSADPGAASGDGRFRTAFLLVLLLVIAAAAVYLAAPTLADAVPGLRAPLASYVDAVNALRAAIDGALSSLAAMLTGAEPGTGG